MTMAAATGRWSRDDDDGDDSDSRRRPHHRGHRRDRARTPVPAVAMPLLLLLLFVALLALSALPSAAAACASAADCSARGVCLPTAVCQCPAGWLGAQCEFGSTAAEPIFVAQLSGLLGQRIVQEWRILPADAASGSPSRRLHLRWTVNTDTWFGGVSGRTRTQTLHSVIRRTIRMHCLRTRTPSFAFLPVRPHTLPVLSFPLVVFLCLF